MFHFPGELFSPIQYAFIKLKDDYETPYLDDKQIRNLPKLTNMDPETFVDWYTSMEDELMMITRVGLLPFDAIKINYQYVGLCIPGVGEKKFMEMGKILYRVFSKTLPHEFDVVKQAFQNNSCRVKNGYRLLWDVMTTSLPAFCSYVKFQEPTWPPSRDVTTHAKRWILFFRFMSKTYSGYSNDTEQSLHFLRTIPEPALLSQVKSLEVSILNINEQVIPRLRGRADLPPHLCIDSLAKTLALTVQPLLNDLHFSPSTSATTMISPLGFSSNTHFNTNGYHLQPQPYGPTPAYEHHIMQGHIPHSPMVNWTEHNRSGTRSAGGGGSFKCQSGAKGRGSGRRVQRENTTPKVICQACYAPGHEAVTCWTLARALLAYDFIKHTVDKQLLHQVQQNYKKKFQPPEHPRANRMCVETLWTYCADNHTNPESVSQQLDWKGLAEPENEDEYGSDGDLNGDGGESTEDEE
jgi:hypothetical protein